MVAAGWFIALVASINERPVSPRPQVASRLPIGSRRISVMPICRSHGATAVSMNWRSWGSASKSSVSGLGMRASAIIVALMRSAVMPESTRPSTSSWPFMARDLRYASGRGRAAGSTIPARFPVP